MLFQNSRARSGFVFLAFGLTLVSLGFSTAAFAKIKTREAFPQMDLKVIQDGATRASTQGSSQGAKAGRNARKLASVDASAAAIASTSLSTQSYKGKVVLVDFWASWCEPCKLSLPAYDKLQSKYKKKGLVVLGVNVDNDEALAREFLNAHQVSFLIAYDAGQKLAGKLEIALMPTSFIIDRKGNVKVIHQGFRAGDVAEIEKSIQKVL